MTERASHDRLHVRVRSRWRSPTHLRKPNDQFAFVMVICGYRTYSASVLDGILARLAEASMLAAIFVLFRETRSLYTRTLRFPLTAGVISSKSKVFDDRRFLATIRVKIACSFPVRSMRARFRESATCLVGTGARELLA